ncbi:aspartate aminotransferase [Vibrio astriarenae]|nr:aspartate aminotransferase [Vibrio sp. C7]
MQALLHGLLEHDNFKTHITTIRELYKSRYDVMFLELEKQLPTSCVLRPVDGGMFVWVEIPECDTFELAKQLLVNGVAVVPSPVFYPEGAEVKTALRLNFTNATSEELRVAVNRLAHVLNRVV